MTHPTATPQRHTCGCRTQDTGGSLSGLSPVYGFLKQPSMVDFTGRLAGVFFLSGCNFRCRFCHNPGLIPHSENLISWKRLEKVCSEFADNWVDAAVITGGEPTLSPALGQLIGFFKTRGWAVKLDTNGSAPDRLGACLPQVDYVAMDLKADLEGYEPLAAYSRTENIRSSVDLLKREAPDYEFRTTVLPVFHTDRRMAAMGEILRGAARYALQPFVPKPGLPDPALESVGRTPPERLDALGRMMQPYADEVIVRGR